MRILSKKEKLAPNRPICQAQINRLSHDGRGVADIAGKKTFIFGALPDEEVAFQYTAVRGRLDEGKVVEPLIAAPDRVQPQCSHFGVCGGCQLQHLSTDAQRRHKEAVMLEQISHLAKVQPETVLPPLKASEWGYRRKARLGVRFVIKKDKLLIGFREQQANKLADLSECAVLVPSVAKLLPALREVIASLSAYQAIPQIEVSVGTGPDEIGLIIRHLEALPAEDEATLIDFAKVHHINLFLQPKNAHSIHCIWPSKEKQYLRYVLADYNLKFDFKPADFTQVNHEMNALMVARALSLLDPKPTDRILDLFCGIGNFSLPLAQRAEHVTGVEGSEDAILTARHNAALNQIENVAFHVQDLTQPPSLDWAEAAFDLVLLDPPRTGAQSLMPWLCERAPKKIAYISCQPATMARDAAMLVENGYTLKTAGIMDMFPHTAHVESIALFERCKKHK